MRNPTGAISSRNCGALIERLGLLFSGGLTTHTAEPMMPLIAGRSGSRPERERLSVDSRKASTRREPELPAGSFLSGAAILERPPD